MDKIVLEGDPIRELKYRAIAGHGHLEYSTNLFFFEEEMITENSEHTPVMEYIGLKDKNGSEIYEDDFVKKGNSIGIVVYSPPCFRVKNITDGFPFYKNGLPTFEWGELEVIGNKIDNPELLKV